MIVPVDLEHISEINENLDVYYKNGVAIIDNFYKNYDALYEMCTNMHVPSWKKTNGSANFVDYYDCRPIMQNDNAGENYTNKIRSLNDIIDQIWDPLPQTLCQMHIAFNYYKNIKRNVSNKMQFYPHIDEAFNCICFIDKICSGGTAIYDMDFIENRENEYVLYDISNIPKIVIEAKPNRMIIIPGKLMHGGYIEDHTKYENDWRINEVTFFKDFNEDKFRTE
jgi:hypothetical protein